MFPKYPTLCLDIVSCNYIVTVNIRRTLPRVEDVGLHYPHATNGLLCFSQIATENKTNKSWSIIRPMSSDVLHALSTDRNLFLRQFFLLGCIWPKVLGWFWLWAIGYLVVLLDGWCWLWPTVVGCCGLLDLWMYRWLLVVVLVVRPQCPPICSASPLSLSKTALVKFKHPTVEAANFVFAIKF